MIFLAIILFILTLALGSSVFNASRTFERINLFTLSLDLLVSLAIGIGLASVIQFWTLWLTENRSLPFVMEFAVALLLCGLVFARRRSSLLNPPLASTNERRHSTLDLLIFVAVAVLLFVLVASLVGGATKIPHGKWDAWTIWNLRARFLLKADSLDIAFSGLLGWSHTDYPLLLPLSVLRSWPFLGTQSQFAPLVLSTFFTAATIGVLFLAVATLASPLWGLFGFLLFIANRIYLRNGLTQFADIPLSLFFLLTLVLFFFYDQGTNKRPHFILLAGITAGLAAWTKNEGLVFVIAVVAGRCAKLATDRDSKAFRIETVAFVSGLAPIGVTLLAFKARFAHTNDLFVQDSAALLERLMLLDRYRMTFERFLTAYGAIAGGVLVWLIGLVAISIWQKRSLSSSFVTPLCVMLIMHLGYFLIYILTPQNLNTHLITSLDRLISQLWPSLVFVCVLLIPRRLARFENRESLAR